LFILLLPPSMGEAPEHLGQGLAPYTALSPLGSLNSWLSHGNLAGLGVSAGRPMVRRPHRDLSALDMKGLPNIGSPSPLHLWMVRFPSKRAGIVGKYADTGVAVQDPIARCFGSGTASRVGAGSRPHPMSRMAAAAYRTAHGGPQEDRPSPAQTHTPPVLPVKLGTMVGGLQPWRVWEPAFDAYACR
jgi:hypothetical protein